MSTSAQVNISSHEVTRQHIALLVDKRDKLNHLIATAEDQYCLAVKRAWKAGALDWVGLRDAYKAMQDNNIPQFGHRWLAAGLPHYGSIHFQVSQLPDSPDGCWHGTYPFSRGDAAPPKGTSVVYVLFTADRTPCYVGSTQNFWQRIAHHRDKNPASWLAHPCRDRDHAYEVEERFHRQYLPPLNRKVGK